MVSEGNGVRKSYSYLLMLFWGGRDVKKTSMPFPLALCELKNYSYTGTKSKATRLLRLTRLHAD